MKNERGRWPVAVLLGVGATLALMGAWGENVAAGRVLDPAEVLQGVQVWLDGTRDLQARFEQELVSGALGSGLEESGRLYLARPGRMRWDYLDPERKVALIEGDRSRLYLEEDEQLWEGEVDRSEGLLPVLLAAEDRLSGLFEATLAAIPANRGEPYALRLVPVESTESVEVVTLSVRPPKFAIEQAEVLDAAGNRIVYRFSGMKRNRGMPSSVFHFEAPPGTEIVASR